MNRLRRTLPQEHTVVLGAGYAGVMAANQLARTGFRTTVVTPVTHFVERVRLHRVASGHRPHARLPLAAVLHADVRTVIDTAVRIHPGDHRVALRSGRDIGYDRLVVAIGSASNPRPGSNVHRIASEGSAARLRDTLRKRPDWPITVVGAGLTGIELACVLAADGRAVTLVSRHALPDDHYHLALQERLTELEIVLQQGEIDNIADRSSVVVDTTGFTVPSLAADSGLPVDDHGRLTVQPDLLVPDHDHIVGAGDAVHVTGEQARHLRMSCATALPMGVHAAGVIRNLHRGHQPEPFRHRYAIQSIDLGATQGRVQFVTATDAPRPFALTARLGAIGKELVVRSTIGSLRRRARLYAHHGDGRR